MANSPNAPFCENPQRRRWLMASAASFSAPLDAWSNPLGEQLWKLPREIKLRNVNTGKSGSYLYFDNGEYVLDGYHAACALLLDHRENRAIQMEPALLNLSWAAQHWYQSVQQKSTYTRLHSPYRAPKTNRLVGGSPTSSHLEGKALDGVLEGVSNDVYAAMLWKFKAGGVGLYPKHVHWDIRSKPVFWRSTLTGAHHE